MIQRPWIRKGVALLYKYRYVLALAPFFLGTMWFFVLERQIPVADHYIEVPLDDKIPFIPFFVVPYVIWYGYIAAALLFFFWKSPDSFVRIALFLGLGMMVSCCVFALFPNGQMLRPFDPGDGVFASMILSIYRSDTSTNSLPSIHVLHSMAVHIAISRYIEDIDRKSLHALRIFSFALCVIICASTVFIKQHSIADVLVGCVVSWILSAIIYNSRILTPIYTVLGVNANGARPLSMRHAAHFRMREWQDGEKREM